MTMLRRLVLHLGAAVLLLTAAACGDSRSAAGDTDAEASGGSADTGAFTVDAAGCPPDASEPLADGEPIKLGVSLPLSGPLASAGLTILGMEAYFEQQVNAKGGIDGHPVEVVARDDAYDASRAVSNAQAFVGPDGVLASAAQISEASIQATQPIYEDACVPQLWVITTSSKFSDPEAHPWTILGIPPAEVESTMMAEYIASAAGEGATVMELVGPGALGQDFHAAFPPIAQDHGLEVLEPQSVAAGATSVDAQVAAIAAANPDAVVSEVLPNYCPQLLEGLAKSGYEGEIVLNSACNGAAQWITPVDPAGDGAVAPMFRKDPADQRYADDPAMRQYYADMEATGSAAEAPIGNALDGYNWGALITQNLKDAAAMDGGLTRVNVMNAAWHTTVERPLELIPTNTTSGLEDRYLVEAGEMHRYSAATKGWETTDVTINIEGETGDLVAD